MRQPSRAAALAALVLLVLTAVLKRRGWILVLLALTGGLLGFAHWRIERLERAWPREREARVLRAEGRLQERLRQARLQADSLARRALALENTIPETGFRAVQQLVPTRGLESGVVVFEANGSPRIWGGRFRLLPAPSGDSVGVRLTPYYAVMEVRRHAASGRTAVGAVLLEADPAVPDPERSLATQFREQTVVGLHFWAPHAAPNTSDVFDYVQPTTGGERPLFSVEFIPPQQEDALARTTEMGKERVAWALLLTLLAGIWVVPAGLARLALGLLPIGLALRAPLGSLLGIAEWFDPSVYHSRFLGPITAAAGPLALLGIGCILLGALLWERPVLRRLPGYVLAAVLLAATPYLLARLGRGIVPPASGVPAQVWLIWHFTLFLAAAGLLTLALALVRRPGRESGWLVPLAAGGTALVAAWLGLLTWDPTGNWPSWYLLLWLPPLLLLLIPADRRATVLAVAIVAGSGAGLLAWSAEITGKLRAARNDLRSLSDEPDPKLEAALHELGSLMRSAPLPQSNPELYRLWHQSPLSVSGAPAVLGVWNSDGTLVLDVRLDELDLPAELLATLIRELPAADSVAVVPLRREPAVHHVLLARADSGRVLSVALGPPTALVAPSRLGRLLRAQTRRNVLYELTLAPASSTHPPSTGVVTWRRENRLARGARTVLIAGVARDIFATVQLGTTGTLMVRGALVLVLDALVLAGFWLLAAGLAGQVPKRPAWMPRLRSYEARLAGALAIFFLVPTLGFAAWGIGRLRAEVRDSKDRMIEQSLRDVIPASGALPGGRPALDDGLRALGSRVDADFAAYRDGAHLAGSTGGLLEALGLLPPFMDADAYHLIAFDGAVVASADGPSRAIVSRIGYRAIRLSDLGAGVLATPQSAFDPVLRERQRDLAMLFVLATLAGVVASLLLARLAARALARPVANLREAALAFGKGEPALLPAERPPPEFAPVFSAFEKMTADVRRSRDAQERVARIVAWGEMANQVAHEIKNPLTPMRLGVQHLRRVHRDGHTPIGPVLESTTSRILAEIDRLDRIARSFSRFGVPASERGPLETVNLPSVIRDVAELYRLGPEGADIVVEVTEARPVAARADEVKEVLVNLLENSRNARSRVIRIRLTGTVIAVEDDGCGIAAAQLPLIFEPRFSTSTSGSGLGLPIVKRLVESWGGRVEVVSQEGKGTTVSLHLAPAAPGGPGPATTRGGGT